MAEQMNVFPECNVDTNLVSYILADMSNIKVVVTRLSKLLIVAGPLP